MTGKMKKTAADHDLPAEKERSGKSRIDPDLAAGENLVEEPTGSATMINLDGRRDFDHRP